MRTRIFSVLSLLILATPAPAQLVFAPLETLGGTECEVFALSSDGQFAVGSSTTANSLEGRRATRWFNGTATQLAKLPPLNGPESEARGVAKGGLAVAGNSTSDNHQGAREAARWLGAADPAALGNLGGPVRESIAFDISADGRVVVGYSIAPGGAGRAFRWTPEAGMVEIGALKPIHSSFAYGVSENGSAIVGVSFVTSGVETRPFLWTSAAMEDLGDLPGSPERVEARDISEDGRVIVGYSNSSANDGNAEAFRWTRETGMVGLGDFPGGLKTSTAYAVSAHGDYVVGSSVEVASFPTVSAAFVWDAVNGMRSLTTLLTDAGVNLAGWTLFEARGISRDGNVIVGNGRNPQGQVQAWRVTGLAPSLPPPTVRLSISTSGTPQLSWPSDIRE